MPRFVNYERPLRDLVSRPQRTRRRRALSVFSALAASSLSLAGCTNGAGPMATPSASGVLSSKAAAKPSATSSPTPTPVYLPADGNGRAQNVPVPVLPAAAKYETKDGLIAFSEYWYSTLNFAYQTGNFGPMDKITAPTCALCQKVRSGIVEWNSGGRWVSGALIKVQAASTRFVKMPAGEYQVIIQLGQAPGALHRPDAAIEKTIQGAHVLGDIMIVRFSDGRWKATNVDRLGR